MSFKNDDITIQRLSNLYRHYIGKRVVVRTITGNEVTSTMKKITRGHIILEGHVEDHIFAFNKIEQLTEVNKPTPAAPPKPAPRRRKLQRWNYGGRPAQNEYLSSGRRWTPEDMFEANRRLGVRSTFNINSYMNVDKRGRKRN